MRQSTFLCRTLREAPADVDLPGLQQAIRAAALRPSGAGLYAWLPLGQRVLARLSDKARAALEPLGGQAVHLPGLGTVEAAGTDDFALTDRIGRRYTLKGGPGGGGLQAGLLRAVQNDLVSYRQLPVLLYQIDWLFRDEEKPRGLLCAREGLDAVAASLHTEAADLEAFYPRVVETCCELLRQCELDTRCISTQAGHSLLLPHPAGEAVMMACRACAYQATSDEACFIKTLPAAGPEQATPLPPQKVATPGCHTIADVASFLNIPVTQTIKTMMYADDQGQVIFVVIRGDLDVNMAKLERAVQHTRLPFGRLQPATEAQIRAAGGVPGYASPCGLSTITVIADDSLSSGVGMVAGANEDGYHLSGVSIPRDFAPTVVADIAQAQAGYACPNCRSTLEASPAIELGHCARLGTALSERLALTFRDAEGQPRPPVAGGYTLHLTRLVGAVLETHHDDHGLIWPAGLAPFGVHIILLGKEPRDQAEALYAQLQQAGIEVLYDDRDESPGVKFADADLIGLPTRITVSKRNLDKGCVEIKARNSDEKHLVAFEDVLTRLW